MSAVVLGAVSNASLGELLKGYGVIATVGSEYQDAIFWWDWNLHLVIDAGLELGKERITDVVREALPTWAAAVGERFQKQRQKSDRGTRKVIQKARPSPLESSMDHDRMEENLARMAATVAVFTGRGRARSHPLFPGLGQDGSANYFKTLESEAKKLANSGKGKEKVYELNAALFGEGAAISKTLDGTGGLFFPCAIKRYATGSSWVHEKDAPITGWDFLLAIRGALLLRGAARQFRGSRRSYPAFPFVFRGSPVKVSGTIFIIDEIFLPTWPEDRPRTLAELQMQIRQFQARVGGGELASSAADFRRAVQGRGVAGGGARRLARTRSRAGRHAR